MVCCSCLAFCTSSGDRKKFGEEAESAALLQQQEKRKSRGKEPVAYVCIERRRTFEEQEVLVSPSVAWSEASSSNREAKRHADAKARPQPPVQKDLDAKARLQPPMQKEEEHLPRNKLETSEAARAEGAASALAIEEAAPAEGEKAAPAEAEGTAEDKPATRKQMLQEELNSCMALKNQADAFLKSATNLEEYSQGRRESSEFYQRARICQAELDAMEASTNQYDVALLQAKITELEQTANRMAEELKNALKERDEWKEVAAVESPSAMARQMSCESLGGREQILSLDQCGSLVIVGRDDGEGSSDEEGWRMQELLGNDNGAAPKKVAKTTPKPVKSKKSGRDGEDGWRWEEMFGVASSSGTAGTLELETTDSPPTKRQPKRSTSPPIRAPAADGQKKRPRNRRRNRSQRKRPNSKQPAVQQQNVKGKGKGGAPPPKVQAPAEEIDESGWRFQEMFGTTEPVSPKQKAKPVKPSKPHDSEESWREQECNWSPRRNSSNSVKADIEGASAAASTISSPSGAVAVAVPDAVDAAEIAADATADVPRELQLGDLVSLGAGAPVEYRDCPAVIVQVFASHCSVIVLDEDQRFGIGACWPNFEDVHLDSTILRLGTHVVIDGMRGQRTVRFNGHSGVVAPHPREGHPVLIRKPSRPDKPQLTVCVQFDHPLDTGEKSAILEPRFLCRYEEAVRRFTDSLGDTVASLQALTAAAATDQKHSADPENGQCMPSKAET